MTFFLFGSLESGAQSHHYLETLYLQQTNIFGSRRTCSLWHLILAANACKPQHKYSVI